MSRPKPFGVHPCRVRVAAGPRADGRWYWRADKPDGRGGRMKPVWTGWGTVEEAAEATRKALGEVAADPVGELETVRDLLEAWVASVEDRKDASDHTIRACTHGAKRLLAHQLGPVPLDRVSRLHLEQHRDAAIRAKVAGSTILRDLKYLRQAWAWGMDIGEILRHLPRIKIERRARAPVRTRFTPTSNQVGELMGAVAPPIRRALLLLAVTGARMGEIRGLTWGDIARDGKQLRVEGKTGERWVSLPDQVAAEIATWPRGTRLERVVTVAEGVIRASLARHSEKLFEGQRLSPNGLRRHVVDVLYATGKIDAAASQLGHSPETAMGIYRQVREGDRARAVEASGLGSFLNRVDP